jgi:cytochrome P450
VSALPNGPRMGRLAGTVRFHRDPLGFLRRCRRDFGDVFTIRLTTAGPVVVICDPSSIEALADSDPGPTHAGEARRGVLPMASPLSVFGGDGAEHDGARERIVAAFAPRAIEASAGAIAEIIARQVESWPRGRPTRLLPLMRRLADEIFVRVVLGVDDPHAAELVQAIGRLLYTPGNPPVTVPGPEDGLLGGLVDLVYKHRRAAIARLIAQELQERRMHEPGRGVLGLLIAEEPQRQDERMVDELLALLMAAQEPMAAALTWLTLRFGSEHEAVHRLSDEGADGPFARAFVAETLRLRPPALAMLRRSVEPTALAGVELPAATSIMAPIPLLHRDERRFPEPERFIPQRHLDGDASATWPFGHGARSCIAQALARMQLGLVLSALLERVRVTPIGAQPERMVLRATILVPQRSGVVIVGDRR